MLNLFQGFKLTFGQLGGQWVKAILDNVVVYVPLRVISNGSGSEVLFTLFHLTGMTDENFAADVGMVEQDLGTLKKVLEGSWE